MPRPQQDTSISSPPIRLLVCTALPAESRPWVDHYRMKLITISGRLPLWRSTRFEALYLCETEMGRVQAAAATSAALMRLLHEFPGKAWRAMNVGLAGCLDKQTELGRSFVISQAIDAQSGKAFFPDLLVKHDLEERLCVTVDSPVSSASTPIPDPGNKLFDMELTGFWMACQRWLPADGIQALKTVSDHGLATDNPLPIQAFRRIINDAFPTWLKFAETILAHPEPPSVSLSQKDEALLSTTIEVAKLTATQATQLRKALIHARIQEKDIQQLINRFLELPAPIHRSERARWLDSLLHECFRPI